MSNVQLYNQDCMEAMAKMKDKEYSLAIVDPQYNIGGDALHSGRALSGAGKLKDRVIQTMNTSWDSKPVHPNYINELFRVTKNQIICGGNYFALPISRGIVCWDKCQPWPNFSAWEMIWTSFYAPARIFRFNNKGFQGEGKSIHPTQKPVALYQWLLKNYAKPGDRILDTHLGSGSSAIAADIMGFDFTGIEIDKDYYEAALDRFNRHKQQCVLEFA